MVQYAIFTTSHKPHILKSFLRREAPNWRAERGTRMGVFGQRKTYNSNTYKK